MHDGAVAAAATTRAERKSLRVLASRLRHRAELDELYDPELLRMQERERDVTDGVTTR
jgi:hypothetical protein